MLKKSLDKLKKIWSKQCFCTKVLIFLGTIAFIYISIMFFKGETKSSESDLIIRSIMVSIMGYLLGSKVVIKYNNSERISIIVASFASIACMIILIISEFVDVNQKTQNAIALRGILSSGVGFLISKSSKAKDDDKE